MEINMKLTKCFLPVLYVEHRSLAVVQFGAEIDILNDCIQNTTGVCNLKQNMRKNSVREKIQSEKKIIFLTIYYFFFVQ